MKILSTFSPSIEQAAPKGAESYTWYTYAGAKKTLTSARNQTLVLVKGSKFGLRASSTGSKVRLVAAGELTKVFTIDAALAAKLKAASASAKGKSTPVPTERQQLKPASGQKLTTKVSKLTATVDAKGLAKLLLAFVPAGKLTEDKLYVWREKVGDFFHPVQTYLASNTVWLENHTAFVKVMDKLNVAVKYSAIDGPLYRGVSVTKPIVPGKTLLKKPSSWALASKVAAKFAYVNTDAPSDIPTVLSVSAKPADILFADAVVSPLRKSLVATVGLMTKALIAKGADARDAKDAASAVFKHELMASFSGDEDEVTLRPGSYVVAVHTLPND